MTAFRDAYREFTGKTVEEALRGAREEFGVGLDELDFEILTPGSRGVLGMGAEPARVLAAPRSLLGGATPKREAAAQVPLPAPSADSGERPRHDRDFGRDRDRGPRPAWRENRGPDRSPDRDRGPRQGGGAGPRARQSRTAPHGPSNLAPNERPAPAISTATATEAAGPRRVDAVPGPLPPARPRRSP